MRSLLALLLACSPALAFLPPSFDDAPLRAVCAIDRQHVVAVGDHGTVWQTLDGGKTWDRMKSGSKASLRAVSFVNELQGWAVGRIERAGDTSVGAVLKTEDGGLTWTEATDTPLPGLNVVKFFDEKTGIAAGDGTPAAPSGLFATADGGKTWLGIPGPRASSWVSGQFDNLSDGELINSEGEAYIYQRGKFQSKQYYTARAVCPERFDVTVGDDGEIQFHTASGEEKKRQKVILGLNFKGIARSGNSFWAIGSPGSVVLCGTWNGGREAPKCDIFHTGWPLPLHALAAASENDVYAVGELGAILKSADGGKTWKLQRAGGQRAAVLFAHAFTKNVPLDAIGVLGGRDGYYSAAVSFCTSERADYTDEHRLSAAVRMAGGVGTDCGGRFTVPSLLADAKPEELLAHWGKDGEEQLVRRMVLAFRMWQPEVVVSDFLSDTTGPAEQLVLKAAQKAFKLAEDPKAYPEQIEKLGLKAFAPKKLFALCPPADAHVKMDQTTFARTLVDTPQGYTENAFGVLGDALSPPAVRGFLLVSHRVPGSEKHDTLTAGFEFAEGGIARRKLPQFGSADELFKMAKEAADQRRTLEVLLLAADTPVKTEAALGQAAATLKKMPDDFACRTAVGLGRQLAAQGKWVPAREMYSLAVARYGTFGEANEAAKWLTRHYASSEARRRSDGASVAADIVVQAGGTSGRMTEGESAQLWARACLDLEDTLKAFGTTPARDPAVMLSTLAAKRALGRTADAAEQVAAYFKLAAGAKDLKAGGDLWRDCIAAELWLNNREAVEQPKAFALCPKAADRPHLDGKLDDACWKGIKPLSLENVSGEVKEYGTKAYFTADDEYLYFAVECSHPAGKSQPKAEKRRRDDDLRGKDRVDILLDVDRDYQTYYRLQIDQRGCVADDCTGDPTWNPKWFVAAEPTDTGWTAEIAIPRAELTGGLLKPGSTWAMNVTRVVPGAGCRTWSGPAAAAPRPEGMGLMQFQERR
jgi:photosystem II stability/assembly factor-like uncharacterized protein